MNKITLLGSGTSTGVPILGCNCKVCQSNDLRNQRLRASILLETKKSKTILVDTSPDLRTQLLRSKTKMIDAVVVTHDHADHIFGMDDVRPYTFIKNASIPVYADAYTMQSLREKFPYIFQREKVFANKPVIGGGIPMLDLKEIRLGEQEICDENFEVHSVPHGYGHTLCFRHSKMAYVVDCREIPEPVIKSFRDAKLDLLIIDCVRFEPHQTHLHLDLALEYIQKIAPTTAILTHLGHEFDYLDLINQLEKRGSKNVFPGIDGQSFLYS